LNCDLAIEDLVFYIANVDAPDQSVLNALTRLQEQQNDG